MDEERKFELYKMMVEDLRDTRKARRDFANFMVTLNISGLGALVTISAAPSSTRATSSALLLALAAVCVVWRASNAYYTRLLAVKYKQAYFAEEALGIDMLRNEFATFYRRGLFRFSHWNGCSRSF